MGQDFRGAGCAKTDRVRHAGILGGAKVSEARRQVEHVARLQHPFFGALEVGENAQVAVGQHRAFAVAHLPDAPAALSMGLQQEHIVVIEVRSDAATRSGIADHHIVDAPVGQKAEMLDQHGDVRHELVDRLHQQGPVTLRQLLIGVLGEWTSAQLPGGFAVFDDQTGLDVLFEGEAGQFVRRDRALETRDGLADQQRLLLPVIAQEFPSTDAAQNLKWNIRSHA